MAYQYAYVMKGLSKTYPGAPKPVFKDITLSFLPGAKIAIIGPNGAGKSTLMKIMAGIDKEYQGEAWAGRRHHRRLSAAGAAARSDQDVRGNVMDGVRPVADLVDRFNAISAEMADPQDDTDFDTLMEEMGDAAGKDRRRRWLDARQPARNRHGRAALPAGRLPRRQASRAVKSAASRCASCCSKSPTSCCSTNRPTTSTPKASQWLEKHLMDYKGNGILVTHDRYFLDNVVNWMLELDRGRAIPLRRQLFRPGSKPRRSAWSRKSARTKAAQKAIKDELEWIRSSAKARQTKSKARIKAFDELVEKQDNRRLGKAQILIQIPERLGNTVIEANNLTKAYGDKLLFENSQLQPAAGRHRRRHRPQRRRQDDAVPPDHRPGTARQRHDPRSATRSSSAMSTRAATRSIANKNVWEEISGGARQFYFGKNEVLTRAYVGAFNFKGADQQKKVGQLSGGERNRVHMAKMLVKGGNVLLLDEPTNDLDVETLRALEEALESFAGCAVVISHDRFFLDRLATHILAFEGDSHVEWFEGNFEAYEEDKRRRLGDAADRPHALTYKKLTR